MNSDYEYTWSGFRYIYNTYRTPMIPMWGSNFLARSKLDTLLSDGFGLVPVIKSGIFAWIKEIIG